MKRLSEHVWPWIIGGLFSKRCSCQLQTNFSEGRSIDLCRYQLPIVVNGLVVLLSPGRMNKNFKQKHYWPVCNLEMQLVLSKIPTVHSEFPNGNMDKVDSVTRVILINGTAYSYLPEYFELVPMIPWYKPWNHDLSLIQRGVLQTEHSNGNIGPISGGLSSQTSSFQTRRGTDGSSLLPLLISYQSWYAMLMVSVDPAKSRSLRLFFMRIQWFPKLFKRFYWCEPPKRWRILLICVRSQKILTMDRGFFEGYWGPRKRRQPKSIITLRRNGKIRSHR